MDKHEIEMLKEQLTDHLTLVIQDQIKKTVNGKIDAQNLKIDALMLDLKPMLEIFRNLKWGQRVLIGLGIFLAGLITAGLGLIKIINYFSQK